MAIPSFAKDTIIQLAWFRRLFTIELAHLVLIHQTRKKHDRYGRHQNLKKKRSLHLQIHYSCPLRSTFDCRFVNRQGKVTPEFIGDATHILDD